MRALVGLLAATVVLLALAAPASAADPLRTLGGDSPLCANNAAGLDARTRADCAATGAIEHPYPLDRYRFDWHIDTGLTKDPTSNLLAAVQWLLSMAWLALLYGLKGVLLAFQWAFSLDLLNEAMRPARDALQRLHTRTLGQPWLLAAITTLGLWALWRGIVQRRHTETAAGLAAAALMMAGALFVIARPAETIGALSKGANDVSLGFLSGAADGTLTRPARTIAGSSRQIFDAVVLRPWCAMNFADVTWCLQKAPGDRLTRAERWLRYDPDTRPRTAEWQIIDDPDSEPWTNQPDVLGITVPGTDLLQADDDDIRDQLAGYRPTKADRERVEIQGKGKTVVRVGLFCLIALGMAGCILLIGWLALRVLLQGLLTLVLLLAAPVMLLAPAFGEHGRRLFTGWAKKLLAAAVAKAIYALLLAIVLAINGIVAGLDTDLPWLAVWLVSAVFWWGVLLKRDELLGWLSLGTQDDKSNSLARAYYAARMTAPVASALTGGTATVAGAPVAATLVASGAARTAHTHRREDADEGLRVAATTELRDRARARLDHRYTQLHETLTAHDDARAKTQGLTRRITTLERTIDQAENAERRARTPEDRAEAQQRRRDARAERGKLIAQRKALEPRLMPRAEEGVARRFIETADRTQVETGERYSTRQLDLQIEELRADTEHPTTDERHAWRAQSWRPGLPEAQLADLAPDDRQELDRHLTAQLDRDRALLAAVPSLEQPSTRPRGAARRTARQAVDPDLLRDRTREARDQRRNPAPVPDHHR
ncbi:hypothetical protein GKE82_11365 [Conexibacter sp. W3-3-2]|uniref:hypothetical protein n=1 Tax=Conexibacter sp. W3-3-2 TaxID=2675227 RepID=UPI0012B979F1|nr:hypothetical protein [Conexibacter sp. W3-3-2]MTD44873.1 hypothetical protein [Conexibacter sp. W3-3-2]